MMMNWYWKYEKISCQLAEVQVKSIYKGKGATADLRNHRGIFIGNTMQKLYDSLIAERVKPTLEESGYTAPTNLSTGVIGKMNTLSKKKSVGALGEVKIQQIDSGAPGQDPKVVETWVLKDAWIKDVKFGELAYDTEDMLNVDVSLRYDSAALYSGVATKNPAFKGT